MSRSCWQACLRRFGNFEIGLNKKEDKALSLRQRSVSLQFTDLGTELLYRSQQLDYIWVPVQYCVVLRAVTNWVLAAFTFDPAVASSFDWVLVLVHHLGPVIVLLLLLSGRRRTGATRVKIYDLALDIQIFTDCVVEAVIVGGAGHPVPIAAFGVMTANVLTHMPWFHHIILGTLAFALHAAAASHNGTLSEVQTGMGILFLPFMVIFARFADRALRQDFATRQQVTDFTTAMAGLVEKFCDKAACAVKADDTMQSLQETFELARRLNSRIVEAEQQQRLFLASMSHELRSPLSALLNAVEVASMIPLDKPEHIESVKEMHGVMQESGQHLLGVINDVLDFSALSSGAKVALRLSTFDVHELGRELQREYEPAAAAEGVQLAVACPAVAQGTNAIADRRRVKQVAINFLSNAVKFTPSGGSVFVHIRTAPGDGGAGKLSVSVMDTGPGISPDDQLDLFNPFVQGDNSLTRKHGGTGLGLSIASRLVHAMGGPPIEVQSTVGDGSTFKAVVPCEVTLPAVDRRAQAAAEATTIDDDVAPGVGGGSGGRGSSGSIDGDGVASDLRLLVADDVQIVRSVLRHMLWQAGVRRVEFSENGEAAANAVAFAAKMGRPFDAVLMDYHMPRCNGVDATKRIFAEADPPPDPPIVIGLTADTSDEARMAFVVAGAVEVMTKPATVKSLLRALEMVQDVKKKKKKSSNP